MPPAKRRIAHAGAQVTCRRNVRLMKPVQGPGREPVLPRGFASRFAWHHPTVAAADTCKADFTSLSEALRHLCIS